MRNTTIWMRLGLRAIPVAMVVYAGNVFGNDLITADPSPGLIFDDTDSPGWNYVIRGRDEWFRIYDEANDRYFLNYDPVQRGLGVGRSANAGGYYGMAMGHGAEATGDYSNVLGYTALSFGHYSTALGYNADSIGVYSAALGAWTLSTGDYSAALGYAAYSGGDASTAIGHRAAAPNPDTIIMGEIPGVNSGSNYTDMANGTIEPLAPLHIFRDDGTASILVQETAAAPAGRTLFTLANRGNTKFELKETGSGTRWQFTNSGDAFRISKFGTGQVEFQVFNNGDAVLLGDLAIGGSFTEMSDRNQKHAIVPLDGEAILAKVTQVPISEWSYKTESADQRHIGPMAQDFYAAFGLASGDTRISARDMAGVNMAALQALARQNSALAADNASLRAELNEMKSALSDIQHSLAALD